jgi:hypothetical protein
MKTFIFSVLNICLCVSAHAYTLVSVDSSNRGLNTLVAETRGLLPPQLLIMLNSDVTVDTGSAGSSLDVCARNANPEDFASVDLLGRKRISINKQLINNLGNTSACGGKDLLKLAQLALVQKMARLYDMSANQWSNSIDRAEIRRCEMQYPSQNRLKEPSMSPVCQYYFNAHGKISDSLNYRALADYKGQDYDSKNRLSLRVGDLRQLFSPTQHFAVNLSQFILDPDYYCRKPAHFAFFQGLMKWSPYWNNLCAPVQHIFTSSGGWGFDINPRKVYQVHFLFASKGEEMSSRWGHAMLRFIVCAPTRKEVGPDCVKDVNFHVVLSYRANVDDVIVNNWDGLTGKYPSQTMFFSMPEMVDEYTRGQWRELISLPLKISEAQKDLIVQSALEHYWTYSGEYRFLSNNCATETDQLVRMVLPRNHPYQNTSAISPLGMYENLILRGLIDPHLVDDKEHARLEALYFPSQKPALEKAFAKIHSLFPAYQSLEDLAQNSSAAERHEVYEKLDSLPQIGGAYLVEKYAAMVAQIHMQKTAAGVLQNGATDPKLNAAIAKMLQASEARLPWNLAGPGYGVPLKSEMISDQAILGRIKLGQQGTEEYRDVLLTKFPDLTAEIDGVNKNLELLTNLRRF